MKGEILEKDGGTGKYAFTITEVREVNFFDGKWIAWVDARTDRGMITTSVDCKSKADADNCKGQRFFRN